MKVTYLEILEMIKDNRNPNTVKWNGKIYKWDLDNVNYAIYHKNSAEFLYDKQAMSVQATRKDIEIIEEDKQIEKLDYEINENNVDTCTEKIRCKINELIDEVNKLKKEKENE